MDISYEQYANPIISHYGLKKIGQEHHGPCPLCGGKDRFWIANHNGKLTHHCRKDCSFRDRSKQMQQDGVLPITLGVPNVAQVNKQGDLPYHVQKGISLEGSGAVCEGAKTVVALYDVRTGEFRGNQFIAPDGSKKFSPGLKKNGVGAFIGCQSELLYVCEGWADAVILHRSTGQQAFFALDAPSLPATAKLLNDLGHKVIVAADNDAAGLEAAKKAGMPCVFPNGFKDFWDLWDDSGPNAVRDCAKVETSASRNDPLDGFAFTTVGGLFEKQFEETIWLVPDLLPTPNLTIVAGPPKVGKSWYVGLLAISIARSGHEVIYIANEDTEKRLQTRFKSLDACDGIYFISGLDSEKPLPKGPAAHAFIRALKERLPKTACVIVDTLAAIRTAAPARTKKDDYALAEEEFGALRKLAHELDLAIIVVHHTRKVTDHDGSPVERLLGSQGIGATAETIMVMKQKSGSLNVELHITGKDVEQRDLLMHWKNPGFEWPQEMAEAALGPFQRKCLDVIRKYPRCTQKHIALELDADKGQVSTAVARLIEYKLAQRDEGGRLHEVIK